MFYYQQLGYAFSLTSGSRVHFIAFHNLIRLLGTTDGTTDDSASHFCINLFYLSPCRQRQSLSRFNTVFPPYFYQSTSFLFSFSVSLGQSLLCQKTLICFKTDDKFGFLTMVRSSSYFQITVWRFLQPSSLVTWFLYEMLENR